jgi:hypothetical protein
MSAITVYGRDTVHIVIDEGGWTRFLMTIFTFTALDTVQNTLLPVFPTGEESARRGRAAWGPHSQ